MTIPRATSTHWTPTTVQDGDSFTALVVDFQRMSAGRSAADVVASALPAHTITRIDPISGLEDAARSMTVTEMAAAISNPMRNEGLPDLLVGYCSATPLALELSNCAELSHVPLVLVAPGFPTWNHVEGDLIEILRTLDTSTPAPALTHQTGIASAEIESIVSEALSETVARIGLDPPEASALCQDLGARYRAWLGFLMSSVDCGTPQMPSDLTVLQMPEPWASPRVGWPKHANLWFLDLPRDSVLDSEQTVDVLRQAVEDLL